MACSVLAKLVTPWHIGSSQGILHQTSTPKIQETTWMTPLLRCHSKAETPNKRKQAASSACQAQLLQGSGNAHHIAKVAVHMRVCSPGSSSISGLGSLTRALISLKPVALASWRGAGMGWGRKGRGRVRAFAVCLFGAKQGGSGGRGLTCG